MNATTYLNGAQSGVGLFGYTNGATIENLALSNVNVTGYYEVGRTGGRN